MTPVRPEVKVPEWQIPDTKENFPRHQHEQEGILNITFYTVKEAY